jgi:predicted lipoprotein with Yx(FWY)xxD motif
VTRTTYAFALLAIAAAMAMAGCGSSSNSSTSTSTNSSSEEKPASTPAEAPSSVPAVAISVGTAANVGKVLVDSKGMTLYYFQKDQKGSGKSKCMGECASDWPPLTGGAPEAMTGVQTSMLGTIKRSDGTTQVTYAGWPLYTFKDDKKPGEDNGTDSKAFGASWYPLHPNGQKAGHEGGGWGGAVWVASPGIESRATQFPEHNRALPAQPPD